jgi:hypothetical protein
MLLFKKLIPLKKENGEAFEKDAFKAKRIIDAVEESIENTSINLTSR